MAVWEWFAPDAIESQISFSSSEYETSTQVGSFDILEYLETSNILECNFPVFPLVTMNGLFVKTDISVFVQYAGLPPEQIPQNLSNYVRVVGQKGRYIGCSEGPNVSQGPVNFFAYGTSIRVNSINPLPDNQALVGLGVTLVEAQSLFTQTNNPFVNPFYPYNSATSTQGGVPLIGECYLNKGLIQQSQLRAHYLPGNKYSDPSGLVEFDFTII